MIMMRSILQEIIEYRRRDVAELRQSVPRADLEEKIRSRPPVRSLFEALSSPGVNLIAEVKKASPSKGLIQPHLDPVVTARAYEAGGAAAISVLTESRYFKGSLTDLTAVKQAVSVPVLRKDFIIDPYQVLEAAAAGADAILLIVAVLDDLELARLFAFASAFDLNCVVEVHNLQELHRAVRTGARIIGINNRDLATFEVDIATTCNLRWFVPENTLVVSESGIGTRDDVETMRDYMVNGVLIGESLVTAENIPARIQELFS